MRWRAAWLATLLLSTSCAQPGPPSGPTVTGCCSPISTEHSVAGKIGVPLPLTWPNGAATVTIHQLRWTHPPNDPETLLMAEVTFECTKGTVKYDLSGLSDIDSTGQTYSLSLSQFDDPSLPALPQAGTLAAGQKAHGWVSAPILVAPVEPIQLRFVEFEGRSQLATWAIPGPVAVSQVSTSSSTY
jgi:hypothetical protein